MALALAFGILAATAVALAAVGYVRAPTRLRCPECGSPTEAVLPRWGSRILTRWISFRWCPACSWEGIGRVGPERTPGRPAAHASGFRWSKVRREDDPGFRWRPEPERPAPAEPPDHPSGFRFGESGAHAAGDPPAHESGFTWAPRPEADRSPRNPPDHRSGFRWGTRASGPVFRWKEDGRTRRDSSA